MWAFLVGLSLLVLPFLLLIPLGVLWLWQEGWLLWWLTGAAILALVGYLPAWWWRRGQRERLQAEGGEERPPDSEPGTEWSPRDLEAWQEVRQIAAGVDRDIVTDRDRLLGAARETIERVARHYHPEERDPIWSFTVPELLMLTERVSVRLRMVVTDHVPAAHLVEAGHLLRIWGYRPMAASGMRVFRHLHNAWRVTRMTNPVAALLAEARQRLVGAAMTEAGDWLRSEGARIWVEEVGRASIELYSGRLRIDIERLHELAATEGAGHGVSEAGLPGPLRVLVAGRVNAGKSSLVNALLGEPAAGVAATRLTEKSSGYRLAHEVLPEGLLVDTPGLNSTADIERLVERAWESDLLLWVVPADGGDLTLDRGTLNTIRARFAADSRRSPIPVAVIVSRIDRLEPAEAWDPPDPLDATEDEGARAAAIRAHLARVAEALKVPPGYVVAARLDPPEEAWNLEQVWAVLGTCYPEARRCRAQRLQLEATGTDWKQLLHQTAGAARLLKRRFWRPPRP
ncbi:MAG: GTP-binding protein HSR1 [Thioalkalivibrio sp.]|nr:MAG: GTP-binding protein HSR1 [Thioalkalivibrio sp.]